MKIILSLICLIPIMSFSQANLLAEYNKADSLLQADNLDEAYKKFKYLEAEVAETDTLYEYILWYYTGIVTHFKRKQIKMER